MSKIFVDQVDPKTATTLTLGTTGDTVDIPTGVTLSGSGTITPSAINIAARGAGGGTGTLPIANGGTAATTLAGAGLANTPAFYVKVNASQTIATATWTLLSFQTEMLDTDDNFSTSTYKFTPTTAGWYYLFASYGWNTATDFENTYLQIAKNSTTDAPVSSVLVPNTYYNTMKTSVVVEANGSSDYFTATCYQASGSNKDTQSDTTMNYFGGYKLIGA